MPGSLVGFDSAKPPLPQALLNIGLGEVDMAFSNLELMAAAVGVVSTVITLVRAFSRKEVRLKHHLEILALYRDLDLDERAIVTKIENLHTSIYQPTGPLVLFSRLFYLISTVFNVVLFLVLDTAAFISFGDENPSMAFFAISLSFFPLAFAIVSGQQLWNSFEKKSSDQYTHRQKRCSSSEARYSYLHE